MGKKAGFENFHLRPVIRRKIKVLALFFSGGEADYVGSLVDAAWQRALAEEKVNDHMLVEPEPIFDASANLQGVKA